MTESEWLGCSTPWKMIQQLDRRASERKLRLFCVACCRRHWNMMKDKRMKSAIVTSERYADRMASEDEAMTAAEKADELWRIATDAVVNPTNTGSSPFSATDINLAEAAVEAVNPLNATHSAIHVTSLIASPPVVGDGTQVEEAAHCHLIRDIFGNPYRPVEVDPALLSDDVIALARTFYDSSTFNRLSKLAEALDRANCRDTVVLNHCRLETEHVRGCWVIDTILGFT